jgi:hypothetical protein
MAQSSWQNEIKSSIEGLAVKSAEARSKLLKDGIKFFKHAKNGRLDISSMSRTGTLLFSEVIAASTKLYFENASKMIDLCLSLSNGMLSAFKIDTADTTTPSNSSPQAFTIQLLAAQGELCRTVFILESNKKNPVKTSFCYSHFHACNSNESLPIPLRFDPSETMLGPDQKERITLEVPVPDDAPVGHYAATVWLSDIPGLSFLLALQINASKNLSA